MGILEQIQYRNICSAVQQIAKHCFGNKDDPNWGISYLCVVNSVGSGNEAIAGAKKFVRTRTRRHEDRELAKIANNQEES